VGESVTFHAGSEGEPPIRYQWRFLGAPLPGETNETLTLANVQSADEGDYSVVVRDVNGRLLSNPAYLFVLAPPIILSQPQDVVALAGGSAGFAASADGSAPLRYQWRKNGAVLPGATSPTLDFPNAQLSDTAGYYLTVENDFGSAVSRVARLDVFVVPTLAPIPDAFAEVLRPLVLRNVVTDPNVPPLKLTYSLAGGPTNATLNASNGVFRWRPTRLQAPSTNVFTARFVDPLRPLINGSMDFTVFVKDYVEVTAGSTITLVGETNSVPLDVFSSAELLDLRYALHFPPDQLGNLWLEPLMPGRATASMQAAGADTIAFTFTALPGQSLQGTQRLARLHFTAPAGQNSGFAPLRLDSMSAEVAAAGVEPTQLVADGRVVVVGSQPLLEARYRTATQREVTLYGRRATTYVIEVSTNQMAAGSWRTRGTIPAASMTNLTQSIILNTPAPPVFYRVRQQ
jgi:hypothetical protein